MVTACIFLFSETKDFRHDSTESALVALEELAVSASMQTDRANDSAGVFTDANLAHYDAVVWVMNSGDVLDIEESYDEPDFRAHLLGGLRYAAGLSTAKN